MAVSAIPAYYLMLPDDLENFGQSLVATSLFSNNILLYLTSDYFGLEAEFKPLLHTWSLGVEEQFYIVFPLLVVGVLSVIRGYLTPVLVLLAFGSFMWAEWVVANAPEAAFYLLPARAWELLLGSLAAIALRNRNSTIMWFRERVWGGVAALVGLVLIAGSAVIFDGDTPFPGRFALIPTLGTLLVILFASGDNISGRILGNRIFVGVGLVSYSAYL